MRILLTSATSQGELARKWCKGWFSSQTALAIAGKDFLLSSEIIPR